MAGFNGVADGNTLHKSDVVNNLTSTETDKPLSAAQGKALNETKINFYSIAGTGGWRNNLNSVKTLYSELSGGIHCGRLNAGSIVGFIIFKASSTYGSVYFLSYESNTGYSKLTLSNGTWGELVDFNN